MKYSQLKDERTGSAACRLQACHQTTERENEESVVNEAVFCVVLCVCCKQKRRCEEGSPNKRRPTASTTEVVVDPGIFNNTAVESELKNAALLAPFSNISPYPFCIM